MKKLIALSIFLLVLSAQVLAQDRRPKKQVTVSVTIERHSLTFSVNDSFDLATQCERSYRGKFDMANKAAITVDSSPTQKISTRVWWTNALMACGQVAIKANSMGLPAPTKANDYHTAIGIIEGRRFRFEGSNIKDIRRQCLDFHKRNRLGLVDQFVLFNGTRVVKKKHPKFWDTSHRLCWVILQEMTKK